MTTQYKPLPEKAYVLEEHDICYILNEILGEYMILFPRNARYKAQVKFLELAKRNYRSLIERECE